jgi:hypothetical protein
MKLTPFRIERWYERYELTTELMLSSSDCETVTVSDLLALEPHARARLEGLRLGYTEVRGSPELRAAIAALYERTSHDDASPAMPGAFTQRKAPDRPALRTRSEMPLRARFAGHGLLKFNEI